MLGRLHLKSVFLAVGSDIARKRSEIKCWMTTKMKSRWNKVNSRSTSTIESQRVDEWAHRSVQDDGETTQGISSDAPGSHDGDQLLRLAVRVQVGEAGPGTSRVEKARMHRREKQIQIVLRWLFVVVASATAERCSNVLCCCYCYYCCCCSA